VNAGPFPVVLPRIFGVNPGFAEGDFVIHLERDVILAVNEARCERDGRLQNDFFYEDNAAAEFAVTFATDVEAKIRLLEFGVKWDGDLAPEFRFAKAEADEANVGFSMERIERRS